ncbi:hypothetical protein PUNSTDRAFT_93411 [Punctularia strigosozonata HHB-11173 SS5]|uniref:Large ribosomal subunit protein uL30m n=1 Tax=Punctularia strigosozonata (strain HHB-11173) TaxID=741275 RepID=R7S283_PUNST|nr:uncharacterized protein PUNSTDRAFT_93411 [Punctularia strigosozonata HHB-11173 SS5]EIN03974.1 hypothetical protein PUNSTDRAFT_93411 [Punctularia strigosozonata HHB-11173 SS5]
MASPITLTHRALLRAGSSRAFSSGRALCSSPPAQAVSSSQPASDSEPLTHFRITLRRSAISLPDKIQDTVAALGLRRRHQTVYHPHSPETAGKILKIKELVEVENVPASAVKDAREQRLERKASRGYTVEGSSLAKF